MLKKVDRKIFPRRVIKRKEYILLEEYKEI